MTEQKNILNIIRVNYFQPAFLICAVLLLVTASTMAAAIKLSGIYLKKEPLPLKKSLDELDSTGLGRYKVVSKQKIDNPDEIETLGTEEYIKWILEDTGAAEASSVRYCTLFVTYYDSPDLVPHVPEECYIGGGFRTKSSELVKLTIEKGQSEDEIAIRYLEFAMTRALIPGVETVFPVLYVFSVNGAYGGGREEVRLILNRNLFGKFSYFSKVEWSFSSGGKSGRLTYPNKQETLDASRKMLAVVLPVLEKEHWPHPENSGW